jgi:hypothetical protein
MNDEVKRRYGSTSRMLRSSIPVVSWLTEEHHESH